MDGYNCACNNNNNNNNNNRQTPVEQPLLHDSLGKLAPEILNQSGFL